MIKYLKEMVERCDVLNSNTENKAVKMICIKFQVSNIYTIEFSI